MSTSFVKVKVKKKKHTTTHNELLAQMTYTERLREFKNAILVGIPAYVEALIPLIKPQDRLKTYQEVGSKIGTLKIRCENK